MRDVLIQIRAAVLCIGLMLPAVAFGDEQDFLFSPLTQEGMKRFEEQAKVELKKDRTIIRMVGATLNVETLLNNAIRPSLTGKPSRPVVANLFDDVSPMTLITERVRELEPNTFEWVGHVQWVGSVAGDMGSRAILVVKEGAEKKPSMMAGTIAARNRFFRIGSNQNGIHAIFELDLSKLPNESPPSTKSFKRVSVPAPALARQQIRPIEMKLSDDLPMITVITERVEVLQPGYVVWRGRLEGDSKSGTIILMKELDDAAHTVSIVGGVIRTRERIYRIGGDTPVPRPAPGTPDFPIYKVDPEKIRHSIKSWKEFSDRLHGMHSWGTCHIDVMVVYTPEAVGSLTDIDLDIDAAFAAANDAIDRSEVCFTLHRVGKDEVSTYFNSPAFNYHDSGIIEQDLFAVMDPTDGTIDEIHDIRNLVGADLVNLWVGSGNDGNGDPSCGIARLMSGLDPTFEAEAFSVVSQQCVRKMSFVHELAHNMGANHARGDFNPPVTSIERGYGFFNDNTSNGGPWGTIMAQWPAGLVCPTPLDPLPIYPYSYGCRVFVFSNPDISIGGIQAGKPGPASDAADNHWTLNNARDTVSAFRLPAADIRSCLLRTIILYPLPAEVFRPK